MRQKTTLIETWPRQMEAGVRRNVNYTGPRCGHDTWLVRAPVCPVSSCHHMLDTTQLLISLSPPQVPCEPRTPVISVMPISEKTRSRYEQFSFCPTFSLPLIYRELSRAATTGPGVSKAAPLSMTLTNREICGPARQGARALVSMFLVPASRIYTLGLQQHLECLRVVQFLVLRWSLDVAMLSLPKHVEGRRPKTL